MSGWVVLFFITIHTQKIEGFSFGLFPYIFTDSVLAVILFLFALISVSCGRRC